MLHTGHPQRSAHACRRRPAGETVKHTRHPAARMLASHNMRGQQPDPFDGDTALRPWVCGRLTIARPVVLHLRPCSAARLQVPRATCMQRKLQCTHASALHLLCCAGPAAHLSAPVDGMVPEAREHCCQQPHKRHCRLLCSCDQLTRLALEVALQH